MAYSKLRLGCSPISNTVYCGRVRQLKSGQFVWISKEDVTSDFLNAVVEMMSAERNRNGIYIGSARPFTEQKPAPQPEMPLDDPFAAPESPPDYPPLTGDDGSEIDIF